MLLLRDVELLIRPVAVYIKAKEVIRIGCGQEMCRVILTRCRRSELWVKEESHLEPGSNLENNRAPAANNNNPASRGAIDADVALSDNMRSSESDDIWQSEDALSDQGDDESGAEEDGNSSFVDTGESSNDTISSDNGASNDSLIAKDFQGGGRKAKATEKKVLKRKGKQHCDHVLLTTLQHGHLVIRKDDAEHTGARQTYWLSEAIKVQYLDSYQAAGQRKAEWEKDHDVSTYLDILLIQSAWLVNSADAVDPPVLAGV